MCFASRVDGNHPSKIMHLVLMWTSSTSSTGKHAQSRPHSSMFYGKRLIGKKKPGKNARTLSMNDSISRLLMTISTIDAIIQFRGTSQLDPGRTRSTITMDLHHSLHQQAKRPKSLVASSVHITARSQSLPFQLSDNRLSLAFGTSS